MKFDLREKLKKEKMQRELSTNHRSNFEQLLQKELHQKTKANYSFLRIAASVMIVFGLGYGSYEFLKTDVSDAVVQIEKQSDEKINSMADISPSLKKIENYYLTKISYQIAKIAITDENKELLEVYLSQLSVLQKEYVSLNETLKKDTENNTMNDATIDALIENLQLRLELLRQLKKKLKIIEDLKLEENESMQV